MLRSVKINRENAHRVRTGSLINSFRRLRPYVRPHQSYGVVAILALVLAAGTVLLIGNGLKELVDQGLSSGDIQSLNHALLKMLSIVLLLAAASAVRSYCILNLRDRLAMSLREAFYERILAHSADFFRKRRISNLLNRFGSEVDLVCEAFSVQTAGASRNTILFIGGLVMMAVSSPLLTSFVLAAIPLFFVPIIIFGRRVRNLSEMSQQRKADMFSHITESLQGLNIVQAYNHETLDLEHHRSLTQEWLHKTRTGFINRGLLTFATIATVSICIGVIIWLGGRSVLNGTVSSGTLTAFIFYAALSTAAFAALVETYGALMQVGGPMERIFDILDSEPTILPTPDLQTLPKPSKGHLECRSVTFSYPDNKDTAILNDLTLQIAPGEKIALVGPSGAGKSTLFSLLLRFYDPQSGSILFDGLDIRHCHVNELRSQFGLVSQEPVIFASSVADNIRYGRPEASITEIEAAAQKAAAAGFIEAMPQKYDTQVGERGEQLSGGQKQRLAIARAFLRQPTVLLLDEATSSLDAESEDLVQTALQRLMAGRTTIIIAHRLSTIRQCNRIAVVANGQVIDQGTHEELVAKGGLYAHYVALQQQESLPGFGKNSGGMHPEETRVIAESA